MNLTRLLQASSACKGLAVLALLQVVVLIVRLSFGSTAEETRAADVEMSRAALRAGREPRSPGAFRPSPGAAGEARAAGEPDVVAGRVTGPAGEALPALVYVRPQGVVGGRELRCDARGRFRLDGLDPAQRYAVSARAPGYLTDQRVVDLPAAELHIVLRLGSALAGYVEDERGTGLEGVTVQAVDSRGKTFQATTDDQGRYELPQPGGGTVTFIFVKRGYETLRTGRTPLPTPGSEFERMRMRLGVTFRGKVVDARSQEPIEHATLGLGSVQMLAPDDPRASVYPDRVQTDALGQFQVEGVPNPRFLLTLEAKGYSTRVEVCDVTGGNERTFTLDRGRVIEGVVRTSRGAPVAGAEVVVLRRTRIGSMSRVGHPVRTGNDGTFRVESLPGEGPLVIHVYQLGSVAARSDELLPGHDPQSPVELVVD
ncbi:MAG: carboxypeptidase regulatory-like domain-containing protein [Planctomycetes bacterium]|nr:carboxypeptidase regulatory-like domain-containing protein [Planctomycetota bacterium]